jgi:hypothetical protein
MLHTLNSILWWSIGVAGVLLIYASLSYETEDGKIQNLLELWWVRVDDFRQQALSRHVAFMKMLASVMTTIFDRLFGVRIFSVQAVGVSICYSFICTGVLSLILRRLAPVSNIRLSDALGMIVEGVIFGTVPIFLSQWNLKVFRITPIHVWFSIFIIKSGWGLGTPFFYIVYIGLSKPEMRKITFMILALAGAVLLALFLFAVFVGIMRTTVRGIAGSESPMKIVGLLLLNLAAPLVFYWLFEMAFAVPDSFGNFGMAVTALLLVVVVFGVVFNFAFVLIAVAFVCLAILMLLHRLFWPAISRPLYKLQALGISKRPRVFAAIGLILVGLGFGKHEWLWFLVSKL